MILMSSIFQALFLNLIKGRGRLRKTNLERKRRIPTTNSLVVEQTKIRISVENDRTPIQERGKVVTLGTERIVNVRLENVRAGKKIVVDE